MKIKKEIVVDAYINLTQTTSNKFWGLVCLIEAIFIEDKIEGGITYKTYTPRLMFRLQELFYYGSGKKSFNANEYYVRFSHHWVEMIKELKLISNKPNLSDVAIFYFKDKEFDKPISNLELIDDFVKIFKLSREDLEYLFDFPVLIQNIELENNYQRNDIFNLIINKLGLKSRHETLSLEKPYTISSHPSEIQRASFTQTLYSGVQIQKLLLLTKFDFNEYYLEEDKQTTANSIKMSLAPQNLIFYGAPGTGKSYKIETEILKDVPETQQERVTFHPDYDNASFVGSYMPSSDDDGNIRYEFVPQVFTNIYVEAWKNLDKPYYLVIEEINRGNCAEIFGDIFQLLDRKSNYVITPKSALQMYLKKTLGDSDGIKNGKMILPPNLQLLATMNTSDQSLFPMDSAFKRRWTWKYVPINYNKNEEENKSAGFYVKLSENQAFSWLEFIEKINTKFIKNNENLGEDKCIGNYFIKPDDKEISLEEFINKAIFYLWIDVFQEEEETPFESGMTYSDFFPEATKGKELVEKMLAKLEVEITNLAEATETTEA